MPFPRPSRRPGALLLQGAVVLGLVGAAGAWTVSAKTVSLTVDGHAAKVDLHGGRVRDVLAAAHLSAGPHDLLVPTLNSSVHDGDAVALRRGRALQLVVDGQRRTVWVTAASVDEALAEAGLRTEGAYLSASRSRPIPLGGLSLQVRLPKSVTILADGRMASLRTTRPTVRDALAELGLVLRTADRLSVPRTSPLRDGMTIRVSRVTARSLTRTVVLPFPTVSRPDSSLVRGRLRVLTTGQPGLLLRSYRLSYVDGRLTGTVLASSRVATAPVTRRVAVGTATAPPPPPPTSAAAAPGGSSGGLNWAALARCESGGNPRSVSSGGTYRGLYQFSFSTWAGVGGSGDPINASAAEQTSRAQILFSRSGRAPWPVCGRYL